jgi:hypothetical protein
VPVRLLLLLWVDAKDLETAEVLDGTCNPNNVKDKGLKVEVLEIKIEGKDANVNESKVGGVGEFATIPKLVIFVGVEVVFGFFRLPENVGELQT